MYVLWGGGSFVKNGTTRYSGRVIKCNKCAKQLSGKTVTEMLDEQIGTTWRHSLTTQIQEAQQARKGEKEEIQERNEMTDIPKLSTEVQRENRSHPQESETIYTPTAWREIMAA